MSNPPVFSMKKDVFNVPNQISMARLVLSILVFALFPFKLYWIAFVLFVLSAGTDWVDGWWARKYNQITQLGRILDPFCDKILICGVFILLAVAMRDEVPAYAAISGWMAVVVVGRELLVTALRGFIEQNGGDFSAKMSGKLKMVFQCVAAGAGLVALGIKHDYPDADLPNWLLMMLTLSVWLAVISTVQSGAGYVWAVAKVFTNPPEKN